MSMEQRWNSNDREKPKELDKRNSRDTSHTINSTVTDLG